MIIASDFVVGDETSDVFYRWMDCSYIERLDNGTIRKIDISDNFIKFYDLPFGFGCRRIDFPEKIMSIPFGTAYVEEKNTHLFSPVKPMGGYFDLCAKYSNTSCVETFCNDSNSTVNYELLNYCQYCSEGKDFLEFHNLIIDIDNYSDTKKSNCPSFTRFPSSFFCEDVQTGFPVYFMDQYFERLRTPFLCYCHTFDIYSNLCDPVMNSLLRTDAVNMIKFILSLLISIPLCPFAIFGYVVPEFVTMFRRGKLRILNALCAIIIFFQSICVVVACIMFWNPTYDSFDTLYFTTSIALSLNVFFTHYGSLTVLLVFDRICQFLKAGDNKNSLVALILIGISFICNSLCAIYIVSYLIYELETQQLNIILTGMSYVSYSLPWIVNFLVFIYIAKKLGDQLQEKTHISFYKSKYMFQFSLYCGLSLVSLVACLCNFLGRQFGTNAYFFISSFYLEIISNFSNISTFVVIIIIIFDKSKFSECYRCIILDPIRNLRNRKSVKILDEEENRAPLMTSSTISAFSGTTTNPSSDQNYSTEVYAATLSGKTNSHEQESSLVSI